MRLMSKLKGGGKSERKIMIEIDPTELRKGELAAAWAQADEHGMRPEILKKFVGGAIQSMGAAHASRIKNIELNVHPNGDRFFVVIVTNKLTEQEAAEFEAVAADRLSRLGKRLR